MGVPLLQTEMLWHVIQDGGFQLGKLLEVHLTGALRLDKELALSEMLRHNIGVLHEPTAFGKTVTAAAVIARRQVNMLIRVNRTDLLSQWNEHLQTLPMRGQ